MAQRTCSIDGCEKKHYCRGWCEGHYGRWCRHGDPLAGHPGRYQPPIERFTAKYEISSSGCWLWTGNADPDGYGGITVDRQSHRAHRWSYEYYVGPIPAGQQVLHRCDLPRCVNPAHLFVGTQADNMADMVAKGRTGKRGQNRRLLSLEAEASIRAAYTGRRGEQIAIVEKHGLSAATVHRIVHAED